MTGITHSFVSAKAQGADATKASKNEWNDNHVVGAYDVATAPVMVASSTSTDAEKAMALASGGTVCTGVDDEATIESFVTSNRTLLVSSGNYEFDTGTLDINGISNFSLIGTKGTVFTRTAANNSIMILVNNSDHINIEGIKFTRAGDNDARLVGITDGQEVHIRKCEFNDFEVGVVICANLSTHAQSYDCTIEDCDFTYYIADCIIIGDGANRTLIRGNRFHDDHNDGATNCHQIMTLDYGTWDTTAIGTRFTTITDNLFANHALHNAIDAHGGDHVLIANNQFYNIASKPVFYHSIYTAGTCTSMSNIDITNNIIDTCETGIYVTNQMASFTLSNVNITGNVIRNVTAGGIKVNSYNEASCIIKTINVSDNVISTLTGAFEYGDGITLIGTTAGKILNAIVSNNNIYGYGASDQFEVGILTQNVDDAIVSNNLIDDCDIGIDHLDGDDVIISGNRVKGTSSYGLDIDATACVRTVVNNNNLEGCGASIYDAGIDTIIRGNYGYTASGDIVTIKKTIDHADITDDTAASGHAHFADTIPAGSIIKAVKFDYTQAFDSDNTTTLTIQVGAPPAGDADAYNKTASGENAHNTTTDVFWGESDCQEPVVSVDTIPYITFTEDDDITDIISDANAAGAVTITITYMKA